MGVFSQNVGFCNLGILHVQFDDAEPRGQIGIVSADGDVIHRLVERHCLRIVVGNILRVEVIVQQVDIEVGIDYNQFLGGVVPRYEVYFRVRQGVHLVVGIHTLVVHVIREKVL